MTVIDKILTEWSFRCHDGIVDMNDPIKLSILDEVLKENGFNETIKEIMSSETKAIRQILSSPEAKGKLDTHSRPKRIKNIGNISIDDFKEITSKVLEIPLENITILNPKEGNNPSSENKALSFKFDDKDIVIVLGKKAPGLDAEQNQVNYINDLIKENGEPISIILDENHIYNNITEAKPATKNKHADFILVGDSNLYIQYKDLNKFQQYSGIDTLYPKNREVKDFVETVKNLAKEEPIEKGKGYKREISKELQQVAMFGIGDDFGENKVQVVCIGTIKLEPTNEKNTYKISSNKITYFDKNIPESYIPYIGVRYAYDRNQFGIPNTRFGFYAKDNIQKYTELPVISENNIELKKELTEELTNSLLNLFINEGAYYSEDKEIVLSNNNTINDLLHIGLKEANINGVNVKYSMEYNQQNPNADKIKNLADDIKKLNLTNKEKLYNIIAKDIDSLFTSNFKPKTVYYLGSSAPLSEMIGKIIKEKSPDVKILPLNKIKFPSWEDMLVPEYKNKIESERLLKRVETAAEKIWNENKGFIKSSGLDPSIRKYFKPKYNLDDILEKEAIMFVDDNVQTGTDFRTISDKFLNSPKIMFYAAIRLSRAGAKTTAASVAAKSTNIPFVFKKEDLKKFPLGIGVKKSYPDIEKLKKSNYIKTKETFTTPNGDTYYLFANSNLTIDDLLKKAK